MIETSGDTRVDAVLAALEASDRDDLASQVAAFDRAHTHLADILDAAPPLSAEHSSDADADAAGSASLPR